MARWKFVALFLANFLAKFGIWGVGAVALLDSSTIPVPMDLILAGYVWADKTHFWLYCLLAAAGSAVGGLLPYGLGRAGGELFLLKRVNRKHYERIRARFERQEFLAMMIPSMLPPPTPWKACVFAAGVFEMRVVPFMLSVFAEGLSAGWYYPRWCSNWAPGAVDVVEHPQTRPARHRRRLAVAGFAWWWIQKKRAGQAGRLGSVW